MAKNFYFYFLTGLILLFLSSLSFANGIEIGSPSFNNLGSTTLDISFSVSQSNTYSTYSTTCSTDPARDCAWIFVKYSVNGAPGPWNHCTITAISAGDDSAATLQSVSDKKGVFLFANVNKSQWTSNNVKIRWDFSADGLVSLPSTIRFRVMGIEMVYITTGPFVYNVGGAGGSNYNNFGGGSQVLVGSENDVPTGCGTDWPNGYRAFYCAKYELSMAQYADYLNTIDPQGTTGGSYYSGNGGIVRDTALPVGARYYISSASDTIAANNFSWSDCCSYASWAGSRPLTEMEFERAGRGCNSLYVYPWGNTNPDAANPDDVKTGSTFHTWLHFANYYNTTGGGARGPTPVGHYLSGLNVSGIAVSPARTVAQTGGSPYGIADLAGNEHEYLINCSRTTTPTNGNGTITPPVSWPPAADTSVGYRGSSYTALTNELQVSNRSSVYFNYSNGRYGYCGFRTARTP